MTGKSESMVELVTRAMIAEDSGPEGSILFDTHLAEFGDGYRKSALAAIKAMREPTEAMLAAGYAVGVENITYEIYAEMIDAALKE